MNGAFVVYIYPMTHYRVINWGSCVLLTTLFLSCSGSSSKDDVAGGFSDETETTELTGRLVDPSGKAQASTRILLRQDFRSAPAGTAVDSLKAFEVFSNIDGEYRFESVPAGTWNLDARASGTGVLKTITARTATCELGADTLRAIQSAVYTSTNPDLKAVFLPQTNQVVPMVNGEALLMVPGNQVEILPLTEGAIAPDPGAEVEIVPLSAASAWIPLFSLNFLPIDPWLDPTGNTTHLQNANAPPLVLDEGAIQFNGVACFQIAQDRDYSSKWFELQTRVSISALPPGPQAIVCALDIAGQDSWCLRKHGVDSLVFWFQDALAAADSLVLSDIPNAQWFTITARIDGTGATLGVTGLDTLHVASSLDFADVKAPITFGCQDASNPVQFATADMDWILVTKPQE